jgi:hypothetical protein
MAELTIDCRAKFRAAELKAERDSILKIDKFNSDWKHLQQSIEKMIENRDECELEENHNDIKVSIKLLKEVLIDIEVQMKNGLQTAYDQFKTKLNAQVTDLAAQTSEYMQATGEQL